MKDSGKVIFSMLLLAGFLPVMMWMVISKEKFTLLSRADENQLIRIWFEPQEVVMSEGQSYSFKVIAESDDRNLLVPRIDLNVFSDEGMILMDDSIHYAYTFGGKTEIGMVVAVAKSSGKYSINVDESSVVTGLENVPIMVAPATVTVP